MRRQWTNAVSGILDYASYPIGMLLVAPVLLKHLEATQYGIWTIAMAAISTGGILASGFGDAHIQMVATLRAAGNSEGVRRSVRSAMGLNLVLGLTMALIGFLASPMLARHLVPQDVSLQATSLLALRIACPVMLARALESVSISTLRAFERYGDAVKISIIGRLLSLASAAVLAANGFGPVAIMTATAFLLASATVLQLRYLKGFLEGASLRPAFQGAATRALLGFGVYSWLQLTAGLLLGQVDRLVVGMTLGAAAVTTYALCVQVVQPLYGFTAAGLHFLFPYLSGRMASITGEQLRKTVLTALGYNLAFVAVAVGLLLLFGNRLLLVWAGRAVAQTASSIFPSVVLGTGLLALSVTGTYALLALGRLRLNALLAVGSGVVTIALTWFLLPSRGIEAFATARLAYGMLSLLVYLPLAATVLQRCKVARREAVLYPLEELS